MQDLNALFETMELKAAHELVKDLIVKAVRSGAGPQEIAGLLAAESQARARWQTAMGGQS